MASKDVKVVYEFIGEITPLIIPDYEEALFVEARGQLRERYAALQKQYATSATKEQVLIALLAEVTVDALKLERRYNSLKEEINQRLDTIKEAHTD